MILSMMVKILSIVLVSFFILLCIIETDAFSISPSKGFGYGPHSPMGVGHYHRSEIRFTGDVNEPHRDIAAKRRPVLYMSGFVPTIASAAAVAGVIAFHEAGHFFAAKWQGMKIQSFNIGYGPKVLAFNDSSDTEFALRAVPLGGYVAFPINQEFDEETGEVTKVLEDPDLLQNRPPLQRAFVIAGGVLANVLLTFLLSTGMKRSTQILPRILKVCDQLVLV